MCGAGYCAQCEIATPSGRVLACQAPPDTHRGRRVDPLRPLGRMAERFPPWFYERRFLRPRRLRRLPLHLLRHLSAAGPLGPATPPSAVRRFTEIEVETAVVGRQDLHPGGFAVDLADGSLALCVYPDRTLGVLRGEELLAVHFENLVIATGSHLRLPPIVGNDLPGVVGIDGLERFGLAGGLARGLRIAVWAAADQAAAAEQLAARFALEIVWMSDQAPRRLVGRRQVEAVDDGRRTACSLFVTGARQPAVELALQGGAQTTLTADGLPIVAVADAPGWMQVVGGAARRSSGMPDVRAADAAFACLCEDVRVGDIRACVAQGFRHPELVKRRTGAMTGPCQGKLCSATVLAAMRDLGVDVPPTRSRPLSRPVTLGELAAHA